MPNLPWILFWGLLALALAQLFWGLRDRSRFLQYPTLAAGAWLFYMIPMAYGTLRNPEKLPAAVVDDGGLTLALSMCILCLACGWWGWIAGMNARPAAPPPDPAPSEPSLQNVFLYGCLLWAVGFAAAWKLASLLGGFKAQFTQGAHYSIEWTGLPVKYAFFANVMYPGILLCLLTALRRLSLQRVLTLGVLLVYPICAVVFLGRRSIAVTLFILGLAGAYFVRRLALPRWAMLLAFAGGGAMVVLGPSYRSTMAFSGDFGEAISQLNAPEVLKKTYRGETYSEFDAFVVGAAFAHRTGLFDYGAVFYNGLIQTMVPRQWVGEAFKEGLLLKPHARDLRTLESVYHWEIPYGSNPTGVLHAFQSFWYFGALLYAGLSRVLAGFWRRAVGGSLLHQAAYTLAMHPAVYAIIGGWSVLPGNALVLAAVLTPVAVLLRHGEGGAERATEAASARTRPVAAPRAQMLLRRNRSRRRLRSG